MGENEDYVKDAFLIARFNADFDYFSNDTNFKGLIIVGKFVQSEIENASATRSEGRFLGFEENRWLEIGMEKL